MKKWLFTSIIYLLFLSQAFARGSADNTDLWKNGIAVIPYPQSVVFKGDDFILSDHVLIHYDKSASDADLFAINELSRELNELFGIRCKITDEKIRKGIFFTNNMSDTLHVKQAYQVEVTGEKITVRAQESAGLLYGVQTLLQLIQRNGKNLYVKGMVIKDWPDIPIRAVHYDTKHFQENKDYVFSFIRTLAHYKINMLIWEWEDKFAYRSHPEIGAPGAFTMEEMQEFTRYARKYNIQIIPLVQGLGHVSYILKHPVNKHLREIESNNWGFCPLRKGTYDLMDDLMDEAAEATPGSEYIHIGCDETYSLGKGISCGCREMYEKEGGYALRQVYINKIAGKVKSLHRIPIAWDGGYDPKEKVKPADGLFVWGGEDMVRDSAALQMGYPLYIYDPNPGIEHLFLPYFYRENGKDSVTPHLEDSYTVLSRAAVSGKFTGMISTSWNCSGVHNQIWMLRYITAAEYSWNGHKPGLEEFKDSYFMNYYGPESRNVRELFTLLNKASYYYSFTFERKVWHWGEVGKTYLPDLPRDDMEFDPYWNTQYADLVNHSKEIIPRMERVLLICNENIRNGAKHAYDFEIFEGLANLFIHTANTCLTMSDIEHSISKAAGLHFDDNKGAYAEMTHTVGLIEANIEERNRIFTEIKTTWEKSQLPKGMSTPEKQYVHARDQQRNFANRRPDLSFMICDEEALGLEKYMNDLKDYLKWYKLKYLSE